MASANNTIGAASTTSKHILNDMPAEIRNKIWEEVVKGGKSCTLSTSVESILINVIVDGGPVHMSRPDWYHAENSLRLNATLACKQVYEEAHTMYFAQNAFLFRLDDHKQPIYRFVEPVANWLYNISEVSSPSCIRSHYVAPIADVTEG